MYKNGWYLFTKYYVSIYLYARLPISVLTSWWESLKTIIDDRQVELVLILHFEICTILL